MSIAIFFALFALSYALRRRRRERLERHEPILIEIVIRDERRRDHWPEPTPDPTNPGQVVLRELDRIRRTVKVR